MDQSDRVVELIREISAERSRIVVIVLKLSPESARPEEIFDAGVSAAVSKATRPSKR